MSRLNPYLLGALLSTFTMPAIAQEIHHHEGMSRAVDEFYSTWYMPDAPHRSCCNKLDCYTTQVQQHSGHWEFLRREDQKWIRIPEQKIEHNRDSPDGDSHICAAAPGTASTEEVFCAVIGVGG